MITNFKNFFLISGILTGSFLGPQSVHAQLRQDHPWQVTLRDHMASLSESDFEIGLQPLEYSDTFFSSAEEVHREWLLFENRGAFLPRHRCLRSEARHFTLDTIEANGDVTMRIQRNFCEPGPTAWYATWNSPINPYRPGQPGNEAIRNRAFVVAAVDLIMLSHHHETKSFRSDFTSFSLLAYAYVYSVVKADLPQEVRTAFETGMIGMFERMEAKGPSGTHGDTNQPAHLAVYLMAKYVESQDLQTRAEAYSKRVYDYNFREAGYIDHGSGFDPSYNGVSIGYVSMGALGTEYSFLQHAVDRMARLKGYLSLPEPNNTLIGPSNFSTSTSTGSPNDQRASYRRDMAVAMLSQNGVYLAYRHNPHRKSGRHPPNDVVDEATMRTDLEKWIGLANRNSDLEYGWLTHSPQTVARWTEIHWQAFSPFYYDHYPTGFYSSLVQLKAANDSSTKIPFNRDGDFIENADDTFLIAKLGGYGVAIHTGRLSWWKSDPNVSGLSGGSLSAFWTPETGVTLLGRMRGYAGSTPDTWANSETWAVNQIWGRSSDGRPFSSARERHPEATYSVNGTSDATVMVRGAIGQHDKGLTAPKNAITGQVSYERFFRVTSDGLSVTTTLRSDETDTVSELWEELPIYLGDGSAPDATIEFRSGSQWRAATSIPETVDAVRIGRYGAYTYISFAAPRQVKLASEIWTTSYQVTSRMHNLMIDLLSVTDRPTLLPAETSVSYTMSAIEPSILVPTGNQPPTSILLSPANHASFSAPTNVRLSASAVDPDGIISRVEFFADSTMIGEDVSAPFDFNWLDVPEGSYSLTAVAHDDANAFTVSDVISITVSPPGTEQLVINLSEGWNLVSLNVAPANLQIDAVLVNILPVVVLVKDGSGRLFNPSTGENTIGDWDPSMAYEINVRQSIDWTITGNSIPTESNDIALHEGWNLVPYVRANSIFVSEAVASIASQIVMIKDQDGNIYYPQYGIDSIVLLTPGQGYKMLLNADATLIFPSND